MRIRLPTKAARRKAQVMAEALDLKLGRVVSASTSANVGYSQMYNVVNEAPRGAPSDEADSPIVPGKVEITATAEVSFAAGT